MSTDASKPEAKPEEKPEAKPEPETGVESTPAPPARKKFLKWGLIALAVVLISAGGGFLGWRMLYKKSTEKPPEPVAAPSPAKAEQQQSPEYAGILFLEPFAVNLGEGEGQRLLRVKFELEMAAGTGPEEIQARLPLLRETVSALLAGKTVKEIQNMEGKIALRNELIMQINTLLTKGKIRNLFFTEFIIQ